MSKFADDIFNRTLIMTSVTMVMVFQLIGMSVISFAQSLSIVNYDSLVIGDASESNAIYAYAAIKNNTEFAIDVKVKRIDGNYNTLTDNNAICWGICHLPETSESTMSIPIEAGEIDSLNFTGHVYPDKDGVPATGDITYIFFDENNPTDSVAITINYQVDLSSSITKQTSEIAVKIYPNPAIEFINLELSEKLNATLTLNIYDITGDLIYKIELNGNQKMNTISLEGLPEGIFLYTLSDNTRIINTGKLIIW